MRADGEIVVRVEHVSKKFCKSMKRSMLYGMEDVSRNMLGMRSRSNVLRKGEFWALDDVSFTLKKGETLGLIGPNGSGKTTLLKLINGIYWPDKGKVRVNGRVGALIAVGAGFHPNLTGRENIYINGAIMGMSKKEIDERFDDIVAFADIGDFLDSPVKYYSSGMFVRLGFAVAVHCEPDVLLVDEVLAVGDREFQIKCFKKIHEIKTKSNTSIIIVSHNEYAMRQWTDKTILLYGGGIDLSGDPEVVISKYVNDVMMRGTSGRAAESPKYGDFEIETMILNEKNNQTREIESGESIKIIFNLNFKKRVENPIIGINFYVNEELFTGFWSSYDNVSIPSVQGKKSVILEIPRLDFPIGVYRYSIVLYQETETNLLVWRDDGNDFIVKRPINTRGKVKLPRKWVV